MVHFFIIIIIKGLVLSIGVDYMPEIRTRIANIQDAVSMSIIHADSWKKAYQSLLPDEYLNEIKDSRWVDMITKGLEDNTMKAWVAIKKLV